MNKIFISLGIVVAVVIAGAIGFKNSNNVKPNAGDNINSGNVENQIKSGDDNENTTDENTSKKLVVYFSAQKHTKAVAEKIAENLNADIFEIVPEDVYTSADLDWTDNNSRVSKEHSDETLRNIKLKNFNVDNWETYDTILIGYPIWWGVAAWPVNTFVEENDFTGKTVIPFCTSASSSLGNSGKLLEDLAGTGNWQEGHRFSSSASDSDIKNWTDSLK